MKASNAAPPLPIPNPEDWCTVAYAAQRLNRSERTVRRMGEEKVLHIYSPRVATNQTRSDILWVAEVEQLREALRLAGTLTRKTGWRHGERGRGRGHGSAGETPDEVRHYLTPAPSHMAVRAGLTTTRQEGTA